MKKNITIGLMTLVSVISLGYGYTQKINADESAAAAKEFQRVALEQQAIAEEQRKIAEHLVIESQAQFARAEAALQEAMRKQKK